MDVASILKLAAAQAVLQVLLCVAALRLGRRLGAAVVLAGVALPWLFLGPWLAGPELLAPTGTLAGQIPGTLVAERLDPHADLSDVTFLLIPWELEVRHALADRHLPFWSDRLDGGSSPWINLQTAVACPVAMLARLTTPIQHHFLAALLLKIMLALEGAWLLARLVRCGRGPALVAAIGFALAGAMAAWALFPLSTAVAWSPWLAAAALANLRRPTPGRLVAGAAVGAAALLAGHPEAALAAVLFSALVVVVFAARWLRRGASRLVGVALLAGSLAAPFLVPFVIAAPASSRAADRAIATPREGAGAPVRPSSEWGATNAGLVLAPLNPRVFGRPFVDPFSGPLNWAEAEAGYVGLVAWGAALTALGHRRTRRAAAALLIFAAVITLLASQWPPLHEMVRRLPGLGVPEWRRFTPMAGLAIILAAALGLSAWSRLRAAGVRRLGRPLAGIAVAAALSLACRVDPWVVGLWAAIAAAFALLVLRPRLGLPALAALCLLDVGSWARLFLPRGDPGLFFPETPDARALQALMARDPAPGRAIGQDLLVYPNVLSVYGLEDPRPHNPLAPVRQLEALSAGLGFRPSEWQYFSAVSRLDHPLLDFLNVRFVVSNVYLPPPPGMPKVFGEGLQQIYGNDEALPRFFLAEGWQVEEDGGRAIAALRTLGDAWRVIVECAGPPCRDLALALPPSRRDRGAVAVVAVRPGEVRLELAAPAAEPRLVATSVHGPEGWTVRGEMGTDLPTVRVNGAFLGFVAPAGVERLRLDYRPPGLVAGLVLCGVALLVLAYVVLHGSLVHRFRA